MLLRASINQKDHPLSQGLLCRIGGVINLVLISGIVAKVFLGGPTGGGYPCLDPEAREIFEGIAYGCERLKPGEEGSGFLYWVRVDLAAPGIMLYVTPKDPMALSQGWEYRLRRIGDAVNRENLSVAINGTLFSSNSGWGPEIPGELANGVETVVANHVVNHLWKDTYLLWFDDQLTPHLRRSKPPTAAELAMAKWGIGGQGVGLWDGRVWPGNSRSPDSRTAIAIDRSRKLLFLAVGENISPRLILQNLAKLGAKDGMLLDGGRSSSMAIGKEAARVSAGVVYGGWQPVATHFGVRAKRLGSN
jgi:hypothetical protein